MSKNFLVPLAVFTVLFTVWEGCSWFFSDLMFVLPAPSRIFAILWQRSDRFLFHAGVTLNEMAGGFVLAFAVAFPLAWMMALWSSARLVLQSLFIVIQCVPMFALAPIMILWFDWSYTAIVIPTALMIFFPLTMNIYQGLMSTPQHLLDYFRVNDATTWQIFYKLQLPWALPHIFAGFRISAAIAGIGAVAGEWAGGQSGLGLLMIESRRGADLEMTFAALFCLTFMSLTLYSITVLLEKRVAIRRPIRFRMPFSQKVFASCLTLVGLLLTGCQQSDTKETRLILDWLPNPNHVPIYVGIEKGIFEKHGIKLKIHKLHDPGDGVPLLTSGQAELSISYMPHTLRAMARGAKLEIVSALVKEPLNGLIFRKGENIRDPKDLNGKVVGYCVDGSKTGFLDVILAQNDIQPEAKRNVSFDLVSTLATERVDAIYGAYWNIECEHMRAFGIDTDYFKLTDLGVPNYYELIILAKPDSEQTSPEFVKKLQQAVQESIDFCTANSDEAFEIYATANPDKGDKTRTWEKKAWKRTCSVLASSQDINTEDIEAFANWLKENDLME